MKILSSFVLKLDAIRLKPNLPVKGINTGRLSHLGSRLRTSSLEPRFSSFSSRPQCVTAPLEVVALHTCYILGSISSTETYAPNSRVRHSGPNLFNSHFHFAEIYLPLAVYMLLRMLLRNRRD